MSPSMQSRFHSAPVRAEMRALDLRERRLPLAAMLMGVIAGVNAASVLAMLIGL
jgi:hypothetical protein